MNHVQHLWDTQILRYGDGVSFAVAVDPITNADPLLQTLSLHRRIQSPVTAPSEFAASRYGVHPIRLRCGGGATRTEQIRFGPLNRSGLEQR